VARRESRLGPFIWQNRTTVTFFAASSYSFQSDFPLSNIGASSQPGSAPELLSISVVFLPAGIHSRFQGRRRTGAIVGGNPMRPALSIVLAASASLALTVPGLASPGHDSQRNTNDRVETGVASGVEETSRPESILELRKTAEAGDSLAQNNLGYAFTIGRGVPKNFAEAAKWYALAAANSFAPSQYNLGALYEHGLGVPQDYGKAVLYYRAAADQGHVLAQARMGLFYEMGWTVPTDPAQTMRWYRLAAEQGNAPAECKLGDGYYAGRGVPRDYVEAARWYRKAAERGSAEAQNNLGALYHHGLGVKQNYAEALYWYRKAAEQGLAGAQSNLGVMYEDGSGLPKDFAQAATWYSAAAEHGDSRGQYNLATLYFSGRGVPLDYVSAYLWYSLAAAAGENLSARQLQEVSRLMTPHQRQAAKSRLSERQDLSATNEITRPPFGATQRRDQK
jgi:TPR repeat protein